MEQRDTGLLLNQHNIKLHRQYFKEMTRLLGINVIYKAPKKDKTYNMYGELTSSYCEPIVVGCIFDEHPTVSTQKKMGWNSELSDGLSIIHVPYDLPDLQVGALFIIPSAIDNSSGRVFKVTRMSSISVYPASIACEIGPVFENEFDSQLLSHSQDNFNLLSDEYDDEYGSDSEGETF